MMGLRWVGIVFLLLGSPCFGSLNQYLKPSDKRFSSFALIEQLVVQRAPKIWVETGTARYGRANCTGDGCSTMIFADFLRRYPGELYSVDIDSDALMRAKKAVRFAKDRVHFIPSDSIAFLKEFSYPIDLLYLDSYDFNQANPEPSQYHHLKEIKAAQDKLHKNSIVMIDDCDLPHGGKGKLVIQYLIERGWKVIHNGYQVILIAHD